MFTLLPPDPPVDAPLSSRLASFACLCVSEPRLLGAVLGCLNAALPLAPGTTHLRRVRLLPPPARVLLCPLGGGALQAAGLAGGAPLESLLLPGGAARAGSALHRVQELLGAALCGVEEVRVPVVAPRSREACAAEGAELWPMSYRVPQGTAEEEAMRAAATLSEADRAHFKRGMLEALAMAAEGDGLGYAPSGAVILLPPTAACAAAAPTRGLGFSRERLRGPPLPLAEGAAPALHPFRTAVWEAIEHCAAADRRAATGGGAGASAGACGGGVGGAGAGAAPPCSARRCDLPQDRGGKKGGCPDGASEISPLGKKRSREAGEGEMGGQGEGEVALSLRYLATGCDAFLTHEPGMGDAMALVHARVKRVVYLHSAPAGEGAFEGWGAQGIRLQGLRALNHHFLVYKCQGVGGEAAAPT